MDIRSLQTHGRNILKKAENHQPALDSDLLLAHILNCQRSELYLDNLSISSKDIEAYTKLCNKRAAGEPLAYLIGKKPFMNDEFIVAPGVLIPRPETEFLVYQASAFLKQAQSPTVLDIGTGSGCIICSLSKLHPQIKALAWDNSDQAIAIANKNIKNLNLQKQIKLVKCDALNPDTWRGVKVDLVVTNPPYISPSESAKYPDLKFEPENALFASEDGYLFYKKFAEYAKNTSPRIMLEVGHQQAETVAKIFDDSGWQLRDTIRDLQNIPRVLDFSYGRSQ